MTKFRIILALIVAPLLFVAACASSTSEGVHSDFVSATTSYKFAYPQSLTSGRVTESSADFTWNPVKDAPRYRLKMSTSTSMTNPIYFISTGSATTVTASGLKANTKYYVKVRVMTADNKTFLSDYSPVIQITTFQAVVPTPVPTTPVPPADNTVTKVLVVIAENKSFTQVKAGMPFTYGLALNYSYASNYIAKTHPSLPNYIDIAFGSNFGISDDKNPSSHKLNHPTVFGNAIKAGKTAKMYGDYQTGTCIQANQSHSVAVRHLPWTYSTDVFEKAQCKKFEVPYATNFSADAKAGTFPNVGWVTPNNCNNAHDCSIKTADKFFQDRWAIIVKSPDWLSGKLAVVFTYDEDDKKSGNHVFTAVFHPSLKKAVISTKLTHESLSGFLSDVGHSPRLEGAKTAPDFAKAFNLKVG